MEIDFTWVEGGDKLVKKTGSGIMLNSLWTKRIVHEPNELC